MNWIHGDNGTQEFHHPQGQPKLCVCRNHGETHWVIYDLRGKSAKMIPNPNPSTAQVRFREATDLPKANERFGDRPHHDFIGPASPNYAWDEAADAMRFLETANA